MAAVDVSLNPVNGVLCLKLGKPISVKLLAGEQAFVIGSAVGAGFSPANKFDALGNAAGNRPVSGLPDALQTAGLLALLNASNLLSAKKRVCRLKYCLSKKPSKVA